MNFLLKMALRSAAAAGAKHIRKELDGAKRECEAHDAKGAIPSCVFRRRVGEIAQKAVGRIDPDKLVGWAEGFASWLERESGGVDA